MNHLPTHSEIEPDTMTTPTTTPTTDLLLNMPILSNLPIIHLTNTPITLNLKLNPNPNPKPTNTLNSINRSSNNKNIN